MKILFYRDYPLMDGTFSLLLRLAEEAVAAGHAVFLVVPARTVAAQIPAKSADRLTIFTPDDLESLHSTGKLPHVDVIHGFFSGDALLWAYNCLKGRYFPNAKIVMGVYHPRAFIWKTVLGPTPDTRLFARFFREVPHRNLAFMNETVRRSHAEYFGMSFSESPIIPLPVQVAEEYRPRPMPLGRKIVSVGRLVEFKNYHRAVCEAVVRLNSKLPDRPLEYHIYGAGPGQADLEQYLQTLPPGTAFFHGPITYEKLGGLFSEALFFVGMGTTIIEASAAGVPSLLAIESRDYHTYGWFFDQPGYEVGEQVPGRAELSYFDLLEPACRADGDSYELMCRKSWERANDFSIKTIMSLYYRFWAEADADFTFQLPAWQRLLLKAARQPYKAPFLRQSGFIHR